MASQARKYRGYRTQTVVAEYLSANWANALSAGAGRQGKDITGVPFDCEVKARADFSPKAWLDQLSKRSDGELGFFVMRLNGQGERAGEYLAGLPLAALVELLLKAGYGELQETQRPIYCTCGATIIEGTTCKVCKLLDERAF